ncbi:splicing factor YJU2 [Salmo salar]|uniref:Splicing factor YJU2 n=1 Tax=Salmo salar TaxID=8030 RepID=A0A1S3MRT1_SALSA|nr:splicing factor YJU2 [Salmo salar]|eukprot:XP_014005892.1 PREDICTED: coiled-coil domain-containing protein 94-like [Salmo salar]
MSERKVLNKYYPPDFDPAKIPKLKLPKDRQYVVRLMAPFNMRCKTCGEYIYKGKKFNARKETVMNELYMGLPIFRFYIKCTRCLAEITFKTDPENTDYAMEHGATRNFQAEKLLEEEEKKITKDREEEELNNPMKVLENRTRDSKMEMEVLENLQELKELNQRQASVDFEGMLGTYKELEQRTKEQEKEEDERETREMLERALVKRLRDSDSDSDQESASSSRPKKPSTDRPTDILTTDRLTDPQGLSVGGMMKAKVESWERSVGGLGGGGVLGTLVVRKKPTTSVPKPGTTVTPAGANTQTVSKAAATVPTEATKPITAQNGSSSLSLLGAYSDSDDSNNSE